MDKSKFTITISTEGSMPKTVEMSFPNINCNGLREFAQKEVAIELDNLAKWENASNMINNLKSD